MPLPLFVEQPFCVERRHCDVCRGNDPTYRRAWAARYQMPPDWPNCPFGIPMGAHGPPPPPQPHELGILVDDPESKEAKDILHRCQSRAERVRPICLTCPEFIQINEDGLQVHCKKGYNCGCGGDKSAVQRGIVHLGVGHCLLNRWGGQ